MVKLPDDEMIVMLMMQLGGEDFENLNESQKLVYTAAALELEVLNGGMVQFLSNEAQFAAPYVCEALEKLGAEEHLTLLHQALEQNKVDLNDLSAFITDDVEAFSKLYDQYNFESFDSAYENLPSIPDLIRSYIHAHKMPSSATENKNQGCLSQVFWIRQSLQVTFAGWCSASGAPRLPAGQASATG